MSVAIATTPEVAYCTIASPDRWPDFTEACIGVEHTRDGRKLRAAVARPGDLVTQYILVDDRLVTAKWMIGKSLLGHTFSMREVTTGRTVDWAIDDAHDGVRLHRTVSSADWTGNDDFPITGVRHVIEDVTAAITPAVGRSPWTGPITEYYADRLELVVADAESGGAAATMRVVVRPEGAPPLHLHTREDESWAVVSGVVRFWFGGRTLRSCETVDIEAGGFLFGPRFVPHTFQTVTPESEVVITNVPGAIEGYFTEVGTAEERADAAQADLFEEYGVKIFLDEVPEH